MVTARRLATIGILLLTGGVLGLLFSSWQAIQVHSDGAQLLNETRAGVQSIHNELQQLIDLQRSAPVASDEWTSLLSGLQEAKKGAEDTQEKAPPRRVVSTGTTMETLEALFADENDPLLPSSNDLALNDDLVEDQPFLDVTTEPLPEYGPVPGPKPGTDGSSAQIPAPAPESFDPVSLLAKRDGSEIEPPTQWRLLDQSESLVERLMQRDAALDIRRSSLEAQIAQVTDQTNRIDQNLTLSSDARSGFYPITTIAASLAALLLGTIALIAAWRVKNLDWRKSAAERAALGNGKGDTEASSKKAEPTPSSKPKTAEPQYLGLMEQQISLGHFLW